MTTIQHAQKKGKEFLNPVPTSVMTGKFLNTLGQYLTSKNERVPKKKPGPFYTDTSVFKKPPVSGLRITWIGHSSVLIEMDGLRLLTDPVWGKRASPVSFAGPERFFAPPFSLGELPPLDAVILSHNHYDHLDKPTISTLATGSVPFYCSIGVGAHLMKWGIDKSRITEMNWGDQVRINNLADLTATPARHFSGRGIMNRNQTLWSSFVIKGNRHNIFFGADSGWFPGFETIGEIFGPFDLTMLEIGAYHPNWGDIHMGPYRAADAHLALKGKLMMPIHWGTFNLALHGWKEPIEQLIEAASAADIALFLPQPGLPAEVTGAPYYSAWWENNNV